MAVPDFTNDFNAAVIQGAEEALKAQGYTMLIISTKDYTEEDYQLLHRRFSALVDGVLVIPSNPDVMDYDLMGKAAGSDRLLPASGRLLYGGDRECQRSLSFNGGTDQKGSSPDWVWWAEFPARIWADAGLPAIVGRCWQDKIPSG